MTGREQIAQDALDRCYGQHADATDRERAWGLKASEGDAVLAILAALYPHDGWTNSAEGIYRLRNEHNGLADAYYDTARETGGIEDLVAQILPIIDYAMDAALLVEADRLGVDVERDRHDPYFLASMLHEIRVLPDSDRAAATRAVNDGATVADFKAYR